MMMKKTLLGLAALAFVAFAVPSPAAARVSVFFGLPGFSIFAGPPVAYPYAPPVVVAPPPVVYAPPVYYGRPYAPAYYYGRPYRGYYGGHGRGWYKHGRW